MLIESDYFHWIARTETVANQSKIICVSRFFLHSARARLLLAVWLTDRKEEGARTKAPLLFCSLHGLLQFRCYKPFA